MAPRARFELATLRLTAKARKNLSAVSGVAYEESGAIFSTLAEPNVAPKTQQTQMNPGMDVLQNYFNR